MIQILGLRNFIGKEGNQVNYDKEFPVGMGIQTIKELFSKYKEILEKIPAKEHWNLFYTIASCTDKKREFASTRTIAFDLDKIKVDEYERYVDVVCNTLKVSRADVGIVLSGNGLHFLIQLRDEITDKDFFKKNKAHYGAVCNKINLALDNAGLPGSSDPVIFEPRRILRLPGTVNRKVDKPEKLCTLVQNIGEDLDFRLDAISDVPTVTITEQVDKGLLKRFTPDPVAVLAGCDFLKHCAASPNEINEPQWYAALSVVSRLEGKGSTGVERCHEMSKGHRSYSRDATDQKITQAMENSAPRTCESINALWAGCTKCPHWPSVTKGELGSPVSIQAEGAIKTEASGFHNVGKDSKGNDKLTPNHEDLIKYFKREKGFKVLGDSRQVYVWDKTHYMPVEKASLEAFARDKFNPKPSMDVVIEWRKRVEISEISTTQWWEKSIGRKMNFLNGYLDIDSMDFRPHDPAIGFRHVLPYEYDPTAKAPAFEKMLKLVTGGDTETIKVLEEFVGYCLSNDTCWAQKALVLTGEGTNGKSTFVNTLKTLVGEGNYASNNLAKIDSDYNLATLDKKLFNISEETSPKALMDNATFKNLVTGGSFLVRLPYKEPYELANRAKMILTCNALPDTMDNTHGFYRRLLIVPFDKEIKKESTPDFDPHMSEKLMLELPGILNIALKGYARLVVQKGFTQAEKVEKSLNDYRLENDSVLYWVTNHLVVHKNGGFESHFTPVSDLYASYRDQMKAMSRLPVHMQKFAKQLGKLRGDIWGEHPYQERETRKTVQVQGRAVQVRGLQGVEIENVN